MSGRNRNFEVDPGLVYTPPDWQKVANLPTHSLIPVIGSRPPRDAIRIKLLVDQEVPDIVLLVNPKDWDVQHSKKISEVKARQGWVHEHWGSELDVISASGTSSGFYLERCSSSGTGGLTRYYRKETPGFQNIRTLEMFFRNNGYNFVQTSNNATLSLGSNVIETVGQILITYRNKAWKGRFDEFTFEEDAASPFVVRWSFTFTVHSQDPAWLPGTIKFFQKDVDINRAFPSNPAATRRIPTSTQVLPNSSDPVWQSYQEASAEPAAASPLAVSNREFLEPIPIPTTDTTPALVGVAARQSVQGCELQVRASFLAFLSLQAGTTSQEELSASLSSRLDVKVARSVWSRLQSIATARLTLGLTVSALYDRYDRTTGVVDVSDLVVSDPRQYNVCPLSDVQYQILGEML